MPSNSAPKFAGRWNVVPSRGMQVGSRAFTAGANPRASTSTRCTIVVVTGLSGANVPADVFFIQWSFTATFTYG